MVYWTNFSFEACIFKTVSTQSLHFYFMFITSLQYIHHILFHWHLFNAVQPEAWSTFFFENKLYNSNSLHSSEIIQYSILLQTIDFRFYVRVTKASDLQTHRKTMHKFDLKNNILPDQKWTMIKDETKEITLQIWIDLHIFRSHQIFFA